MFVLVECQVSSVKFPALKFHYIFDPLLLSDALAVYIYQDLLVFHKAILFSHLSLFPSYRLICLENCT